MEPTGIQVAFFQHLKSLLPQTTTLVDTIADLLDISNDSAYRRIRGETPISLEEIQKLATHFKISLDQFLHLQADSFIFSGKLANAKDHVFEKWTENVFQQLQFATTFQKKHLTYLAKDIPLMQQFLVPELSAFKSFFWRKSILHYEEMRGVKFSARNMDVKHIEMSRKIVQLYNQIGSTDIWNIESINSTIRQIEFYREAGAFESEEDVVVLYKAVFTLIDHIEKQAELGVKFCVGENPLSNAAAYNLYSNELILGDNTLLFELDHIKITFLNHSVINFISSRDTTFNEYMHNILQNLIKKSTLLSTSSERERTRFFNRVRDKMKLAARL
jgi:plasmid maintenance system antidote protein VapI